MKLPSKRHISEFFSRAALFGAMFIALSLSNARAAELVMFEQAGCAWCEAFDREIAPIYGKTEEGLRAPLRRVLMKKLDASATGEERAQLFEITSRAEN